MFLIMTYLTTHTHTLLSQDISLSCIITKKIYKLTNCKPKIWIIKAKQTLLHVHKITPIIIWKKNTLQKTANKKLPPGYMYITSQVFQQITKKMVILIGVKATYCVLEWGSRGGVASQTNVWTGTVCSRECRRSSTTRACSLPCCMTYACNHLEREREEDK